MTEAEIKLLDSLANVVSNLCRRQLEFSLSQDIKELQHRAFCKCSCHDLGKEDNCKNMECDV